MTAYLIGQVVVHDMPRFAPYVERTSAIIAQYGGEVLDVMQAVEAVEGEWPVGALTASSVFPTKTLCARFGTAPKTLP